MAPMKVTQGEASNSDAFLPPPKISTYRGHRIGPLVQYLACFRPRSKVLKGVLTCFTNF
jgi:hypothetical protein